MAHTIEEYEHFLETAYEAIECMNVQIQVLQARGLEQEEIVYVYSVRLHMMSTALARLKTLLNDPPWEKI